MFWFCYECSYFFATKMGYFRVFSGLSGAMLNLLETRVGKEKPGKIPGFGVELRGVEPLSKHNRQKLSTCLFRHCLSGGGRDRTNQLPP